MAGADRMAVRAMRRFAEDYRRKGCPVGKEVSPEQKKNELWRRLTNMTVANEAFMDAKERRAGIRNLVEWIAGRVREWRGEVRITKDEVRGGLGAGVSRLIAPLTRHSLRSCPPSPSGGEGTGAGEVFGSEGGVRSPHPAFASLTSALSPTGGEGMGAGVARGTGLNGETGGTQAEVVNEVGGCDGGRGEELAWACEGQSREILEVVCRELNIAKSKLGELCREYRGIGARELVDGLMVRGVKTGIAGRLKRAARGLWGFPGNHVNVMLNDERLTVQAYGRSEFFVTADNFYRGEVAETIFERRELLLEAFDVQWKRGGSSRDGFALSLGFRNFSELNRACLNVFGKSVRDLAWDVSYEIVEFYVAKELETLREIAVMEPATERVARARFLYFRDAKAPGACGVNWVWAGLERGRREELEAWLGGGD